jgi:hypothetical protein
VKRGTQPSHRDPTVHELKKGYALRKTPSRIVGSRSAVGRRPKPLRSRRKFGAKRRTSLNRKPKYGWECPPSDHFSRRSIKSFIRAGVSIGVKYTQIDDSAKIGVTGPKLLSGFARYHNRLEANGVHTQLDSEGMELLKEAVTN